MVDRSAYNGRPYYCVKCGLGFGEFMACELPDCQLESWTEAQQRAARHKANMELATEFEEDELRFGKD